MTDGSTTVRKSYSESSKKYFTVNDVIKSGTLNVIGQFSIDLIGCKTPVKFVYSHWLVSIGLVLGQFCLRR